MAEHPGFLCDIIERPDDDTPRLVYADWLDDNGEPARAEFIRVQCALAKFTGEGDVAKPGGVPADQLRWEHREAFLARFREWGLVGQEMGYVFRRGFVEEVTLFGSRGVGLFVPRAPRVVAHTPVRRINLRVLPPTPGDHHHDDVSPDRLRELLECPELARVEVLDLKANVFGDESVPPFLQSRHLSGLRHLWLNGFFSEEGRAELRRRFGGVVDFEEEWYYPLEETEELRDDEDIPF